MSIHHRFWLAINSDFFFMFWHWICMETEYMHGSYTLTDFKCDPNCMRLEVCWWYSIVFEHRHFILVNTYDDFRSSRLLLFWWCRWFLSTICLITILFFLDTNKLKRSMENISLIPLLWNTFRFAEIENICWIFLIFQ